MDGCTDRIETFYPVLPCYHKTGLTAVVGVVKSGPRMSLVTSSFTIVPS